MSSASAPTSCSTPSSPARPTSSVSDSVSGGHCSALLRGGERFLGRIGGFRGWELGEDTAREGPVRTLVRAGVRDAGAPGWGCSALRSAPAASGPVERLDQWRVSIRLGSQIHTSPPDILWAGPLHRLVTEVIYHPHSSIEAHLQVTFPENNLTELHILPHHHRSAQQKWDLQLARALTGGSLVIAAHLTTFASPRLS